MIEELNLKGRELFVYAYLYSWSGKDIFLKDWQIASMLGMSKSVLSRTIKSLREKGFVDEKSTTLLTKSQQKSCQKVNKKLTKSQHGVAKKSTIQYIYKIQYKTIQAAMRPRPSARTNI